MPEADTTQWHFAPSKFLVLGEQSREELAHRLSARPQYRLSQWAAELLLKIPTSKRDRPLEATAVFVSVQQLGFKRAVLYRNICARAREVGLKICPPEAVPLLKIEYREQPKGEWLLIGMPTIIDRSGQEAVFSVEH